jgi:hypothetical protein
MELDPVQKILEFEKKKVLELETHDFNMGRIGLEPTPKEP